MSDDTPTPENTVPLAAEGAGDLPSGWWVLCVDGRVVLKDAASIEQGEAHE